jgi:chromosome partitioning protein
MEEKLMRIIAVANQKGGCGKTTTAINLSAALSTNNRKVLLVDLDPQAHATAGLNIKGDLSIYNVLSKITHKKAKLEQIIQNLGPNIDIAPSSMILSTLEQELAGEIGRESQLSEAFKSFKNDYDYIVIDCPPNLGILTINALRACNEVIVPVEASRFSLEGLDQLITIIGLVRERLSHNVDFRVLVTNFDSRLQHSFKMLDRIKSEHKDKIFSNIIHVNVKLKEAQNEGIHILSYDKYCRGAKDYFSLSREIITQELNPGKTVSIEKPMEKRMKEILKENLPKLSEVVFSVKAPQAKEVYLAGEFNDWKLDETSKMTQDNGSWTKRLSLNEGKYHYRFVIDGNWVEDSLNPLKETNSFGTMNSLVEVKTK